MLIKKILSISLYLWISIFVGCGVDSSRNHNKKVNCPKLKKDILHQQKNVENTRGKYYTSVLYTNNKCVSNKACQDLAKKQENFFVNKMELLEAKYRLECENR